MSPIANLFLNAQEAAQLESSESMFINVEEAKDYIGSCKDPIDQEFLWTAFAKLAFGISNVPLDSKFDVLFFMRVLAAILKDREHLQQLFNGRLFGEEISPDVPSLRADSPCPNIQE